MKNISLVKFCLVFGLATGQVLKAQNDPGLTPGDTGTVTFTYRGNTVTYVTVRADDGKIWLQQNLGTTAVAQAVADVNSLGDLYQFGRWDDGHQDRNSTTQAATSLPANNPSGLGSGSPSFYLGTNPNDWWGGGAPGDSWSGNAPTTTNGIDPCTSLGPGWHMPSINEWGTVVSAEGITNTGTAFSSNLKLTAAGQREGSLGNKQNVGSNGAYWSSSTNGVYAKDVSIFSSSINVSDDAYRSYAFSVRCMTTCTGVNDPIGIFGEDTVCYGGTYKFYTSPVFNANSYIWSIPAGWTINGPNNSDTIEVVVGSNLGIIELQAKNSCNNSGGVYKTLIVRPQPVPVLTLQDDTVLGTGSFASYVWLFHGSPIAGASDSTYVADQNGNYSVVVTDEFGCSDTSNVVTVNSVPIGISTADAERITIYPNPANNNLYISAPMEVNVYVHDAAGKLLLSAKSDKQIDISDLPDGLYVVRITDRKGNQVTLEKIAKLSR